MSALNEGRHTGEFILAESPGTLSRDAGTVTVPASTTLSPGYVLGQVSATGKWVPYDDTASDGREVARGVLYSELANEELSPADQTGVVINFGAEVREEDLVWLDDADADAGIVDLAGRYIKAR